MGVLAFLLVTRGPHPPAVDTQASVDNRIVPAPPTPPVDSPTPNGGTSPPAPLPFHLPAPPSPARVVVPDAPPENATETTIQAAPPPPAPAPAETGNDATDVGQALARYAAAVASRQTSRIQAAYPGITGAEIDRRERFFASLGPQPQSKAFYDLEEEPDVKGDAANVVFTLTLEYGGSPHPLPMRGILRRAAGRWSRREVRSLQ